MCINKDEILRRIHDRRLEFDHKLLRQDYGNCLILQGQISELQSMLSDVPNQALKPERATSSRCVVCGCSVVTDGACNFCNAPRPST